MSKFKVILITVYCIGLAVAFAWPLLTRLTATGVWDWSEAAAHYEAARHTILYYGQWPLWNPFICGGAPALANPQAYWISLTGFLSLFMGSIVGPKIAVVIYVAFGGWGMWLMARKLGASDGAALIAAPVYMTSGFLATRLAAGQFLWLTLAFVPWVFYGYERAREKWWWLILGGGALAAIGIEGRSYLVVYVVIMLIAYGLMKDVLSRGGAWGLTRAVGLIAVAAGLSAWKFIPDLFFLMQARGSLVNSPALPLPILIKSFLWPNAWPGAQLVQAPLPWVEYGAYVGWLPLGLAGLAILLSGRRREIVPLLFAGVAMMAIALSVPGGSMLEFWPVLREFRNYHRAIGMLVFVLALLSAYGLDEVVKLMRVKTRMAVVIRGVIILLVVINFFMMTNKALSWGFAKVAVPDGPNELPNIQPIFRQESGYNDPFAIVRNKQGAKEACPALLYTWLPEAAGTKPIGSYVEAADDEKYRGEVYLTKGDGEASLVDWSPNWMKVNINAVNESYVVVNQNYASGWHVSGARIEDNGEMLIGLRVPQGHHELTLVYWPPGFNLGLIVSGLTVVSLLGFSGRSWRNGSGRKGT